MTIMSEMEDEKMNPPQEENLEDLEDGEIEDDEEEEPVPPPAPPVPPPAPPQVKEEPPKKPSKESKKNSLKRSLDADEEKQRILKEKLKILERQMAGDSYYDDEDEDVEDEEEEDYTPEESGDDEEMGVYTAGGSPKRFKYEDGGPSGPPMSLMSKAHHMGGGGGSARERRNNLGHGSRRNNLSNQKGLSKRGRSNANSRRNPRKKKSDEICKMFMQGKCQKSAENCLYSHDAVPPKMMELCKFYLFERCAKRDKCLYLHKEFPCKYYHTGNKCVDSAEACKFSHEPLTDDTRGILLKHLESAPKEILGEFPRLTRDVAASVVFAVEAQNKGWLDDPSNKEDDSNMEDSENDSKVAQDISSGNCDSIDKDTVKEGSHTMETDDIKIEESGGPKGHDNSEIKILDEGKRKRKSRWESEPEGVSSSSGESKQNHFSAVPFPTNVPGIVPPGYGCPNFSEKFKGLEVQNFLKEHREGKHKSDGDCQDDKDDIEIKQTPVPASLPGKRQGFQQFKSGNNFQGRNNNFNSGPSNNFNSGSNFMGVPHKQNFNGPPNQNFNSSPNQNFNGPPNQNFNGPPNQNYHGPPNQNYNAPNHNFNGPQSQNFNGPPNQNYNAPPYQNYNAPPNQNFNNGLPNQNFNNGPPNQNYNNGPPNQNYNNGPPNQNFNGPPNQNFNNYNGFNGNNFNGPPNNNNNNNFNGPRSHNNFNGPRFSGDFRGGNRGGRFNNRGNFRGGRGARGGQQHNYNNSQRGHFYEGSNTQVGGWNNGSQWNNSSGYNQYNEDDTYYDNGDENYNYNQEDQSIQPKHQSENVPEEIKPDPADQSSLLPPEIKEIEGPSSPPQRDPRANRDPRARRDPRKRDSPLHASSSSAPGVLDEAEKERRILDLDISAFGELEIPSLNQDDDEEDDSVHGLPFKANMQQSVAKEIDASILSRPPIEYTLLPLVPEKPDYTDIIQKHHIPASQISQDPRLRRYSDKSPSLKFTHTKLSATSTPVESHSDVYNPKRDLIQQKFQNSTPNTGSAGESGAYSPSQDIQDMYGKRGSSFYKSQLPQQQQQQQQQEDDVYNPRKDLSSDYSYQQNYKSGANRNDPRMNRRDPRRRD